MFGAALVVAGIALLSLPAAFVTGGGLCMLAAVGLAAIQDRTPPVPAPPAEREPVT